MPSSKETDKKNFPEEISADFHGAAIIDKDGKEIPITEEMVRRACLELESLKKDLATD
jgi:methionine-rich copper-binding protein CopC